MATLRVLKPHRLHGRVIAIFCPDKEWIGDNRRVRNFEQSDYGNDRVPWGKTATAAWIVDRNRLDYAGQFIWTGVDYIGEPTPLAQPK